MNIRIKTQLRMFKLEFGPCMRVRANVYMLHMMRDITHMFIPFASVLLLSFLGVPLVLVFFCFRSFLVQLPITPFFIRRFFTLDRLLSLVLYFRYSIRSSLSSLSSLAACVEWSSRVMETKPRGFLKNS